jgi:twitching motility two-component system response regulator PilH
MLTNKILLIDDDPEEHEVFCETLTTLDQSIDCVGAYNCHEGFEKLEASKGLPRYIFLDLNMPASHGKFCLQKLKKHPLYATVPVFIYTTSNREIDKYEAKKFGAQMFFTKPNSMGELKHILSYVISEEWKYN